MVRVQKVLERGLRRKMKLCVIIPTHNEAKEISGIVREVKDQGLEVVVVDDGSQDNTALLAQEAGAVILRSPTNQGKGASLIKGFVYALSRDFDAVITMDGDGQHLPQEIPYFIRLAGSSPAAIFIGNRMLKKRNMPLLRLFTNRLMSWFISFLAKTRIPDTQCGFRLIKREVLEKVTLRTAKYETESEILIKAARLGFKIESVPIKSIYRGEKSQINPLLDSLRFISFIFRKL